MVAATVGLEAIEAQISACAQQGHLGYEDITTMSEAKTTLICPTCLRTVEFEPQLAEELDLYPVRGARDV